MPTSFTYFTDHARAALAAASILGAVGITTPIDVTVCLLRYPDGNVARWRRDTGFDAERAVIDLGRRTDEMPRVARTRFDMGTRRLLAAAMSIALRNGADHVGTEHLLAAAVEHGPPEVIEAFRNQGVTADGMQEYLRSLGNDLGTERLVDDPGRRGRQAWARARSRLDAGLVPLRRPVPPRVWWSITLGLTIVALFLILSSR